MRIFKWLIAVSVLAALAGSLIVYRKYSSFRSAPDLRTFSAEMSEPNFFSPVARYLIFKPGSKIYFAQLADWMHAVEYSSAKRDGQNMHAFLSKMHPAQLVGLTGVFGNNTDVIIPHIKDGLFPDGKPCLFSTMASNEDALDFLYERKDWWGIPFAEIKDDQLRKRVLECIKVIDIDNAEYFPLELLPESGVEASAAIQSMAKKKNVVLIARATALDTDLSEMASRWLASEIDTMEESQVQLIQYIAERDAAVQAAIFKRFIEDNEEIAIESLRNMILKGHRKEAQNTVSDLLAGSDSSIKKDVIVILARNDMPLGRRHIDEAFKGDSPRRQVFFSHNDYIFSKTAIAYTKLSGHDYVQTGKNFPTIYCASPPENEVDALREFISKHPWFPGADDAHLRLVSRLYLDRNYDSAETELLMLQDAEYPDTDAKLLVKSAGALIRKARSGLIEPPSVEEWYALSVESESCRGGKSESL